MSKQQPWPADQVERRPVASLIPYARNARTHSKAQVGQIAASIREFGFTVPVLVDESSGIIAGHGRVLAAQKLGLADLPVMVARGWTDAQKRAYVLADNQLALNAGWNEDLLKIELADLQAADFDLTLTGFQPAQLAGFIAGRDVEHPSTFDGPGATKRSQTSVEAGQGEYDGEEAEAPASSAREIDPDGYALACRCPRCGFEFDPK